MTTDLAVSAEERTAGDAQGIAILDAAHDMTVSDFHTFERAATWLRTVVVPLKGRIREMFRPRIEQAHALHKGLLADERRFLGPVEEAETFVRGQLTAWEQAEAARRRDHELAEQRRRERLEQEAREAAEAETRRLQAEAETRQLEEAAALEARGDRAGAEQLLAQPILTATVMPTVTVHLTPPQIVPKAEGVSFRSTWKWRLVDVTRIPAQYLQPDEKAISSVVRAMGKRAQIPGIEVYEERIASVRSA